MVAGIRKFAAQPDFRPFLRLTLMANQKKVVRSSKKNKKTNLPGMMMLGVGLVFAGLAAFMLWPQAEVTPGVSSSGLPLTVPVEVDYEAPELTLLSVDGEKQALEDFLGKVILVNLWATWCPPCKAEMPTLEAFYQTHKDQGFDVIAINDGDPTEAVEAFVDEYGLTFPVWLDPQYIATEKAFKSLNLPSSFVIDRQGNIRLRWVGEIDLDTLEKYVTPLILE